MSSSNDSGSALQRRVSVPNPWARRFLAIGIIPYTCSVRFLGTRTPRLNLDSTLITRSLTFLVYGGS